MQYSSPATTQDLQRIIDREVRQQRINWLGNIRKVAQVPKGHKVHIVSAEVTDDSIAKAIKIVEDADAPVYRLESPDTSHPYRQKDIIKTFNGRKDIQITINSFDILCVRRVYSIDNKKTDMYYRSKFGGGQYSNNFLDWIVTEYKRNNNFFLDARKKDRESKKQ